VDLVRDGVLVATSSTGPSPPGWGGPQHGFAYADSPHHVRSSDGQRVAAPGPPATPAEELIAASTGGSTVSRQSWSIDMQRYNFQFTAQRFSQDEGGKLAGQLRDGRLPGHHTDFWGALDASAAVAWVLGARQLRQGPARQAARQPRLPAARSAGSGCSTPRRRAVTSGVTSGHIGDLAAAGGRRARLAIGAGLHGCAVLVREASEAVLRWRTRP